MHVLGMVLGMVRQPSGSNRIDSHFRGKTMSSRRYLGSFCRSRFLGTFCSPQVSHCEPCVQELPHIQYMNYSQWWSDLQAGRAPAPSEESDRTVSPAAKPSNAPSSIETAAAAAPVEAFASAQEIVADLDSDKASNQQNNTKTALLTLAACFALFVFFAFLHRVTQREITAEPHETDEFKRLWRVTELLMRLWAHIGGRTARRALERALQSERMGSTPPETAMPTQCAPESTDSYQPQSLEQEQKALFDPPSESSADDHDLACYPALRQPENLLPSQSATLAAWRDKIPPNVTLQDPFHTFDLAMTPDQVKRGFPSTGMTHGFRFICT